MENGRFAYDPWGKRRNPDNWAQNDTRTSWFIDRGYTMHEHLDAFGIINMNGRVYDPLTAMFFSPDPMLTDAGNWLDYNRFGYCLNNPFRYTDPSGYSWWSENGGWAISSGASIIVGGIVGVFTAGIGASAIIASGMAAGAAGGFTGGVVGTLISGGSFSEAMSAGIQGAVIGGMMGGITAGIGSAFGPVGSMAADAFKKFNVWNELGRAGVHAVAQGGFSYMRSGDFWQGAAAGFVSSFAGSLSQGAGINDLGMVGVSTAMGGVGAAIAGGSAEDILFGMVSGAMVGMLNHWQEERFQKIEMQNVWGRMYIISNVNADAELTDGHAWIRLESKDGSIVKTMSLWGNRGNQEYWENLEINEGYGVVNKWVSISKSMYNRISIYNNNSNNINWTFFHTCAGYSVGLWNYLTNQNLSSRDDYFFTTPRALSRSIQKSN